MPEFFLKPPLEGAIMARFIMKWRVHVLIKLKRIITIYTISSCNY
jgi:hypothetical protein